MSSIEQELREDAAKLRKQGDHLRAMLLDRAANEIRHLSDLVHAYNIMARSR